MRVLRADRRGGSSHVAKFADLGRLGTRPPWADLMAARHHKTLVVCGSCHADTHGKKPIRHSRSSHWKATCEAFTRGQTSFFHGSTACSSRSSALRAIACQDQPCRFSSLHTLPRTMSGAADGGSPSGHGPEST
ncbi:hypothetical protein, partial [Streptomyces sp. NPDC057686]|uniref:HNH endonuclease n=1 Tax=Streptomyces sp. NPDC057686 TaxID=3346212 RepID=UPI0036CD7024